MNEEIKKESFIRAWRFAKLMINDIFDMKYDERAMIYSKRLSNLAFLINTILKFLKKFKYIQRNYVWVINPMKTKRYWALLDF